MLTPSSTSLTPPTSSSANVEDAPATLLKNPPHRQDRDLSSDPFALLGLTTQDYVESKDFEEAVAERNPNREDRPGIQTCLLHPLFSRLRSLRLLSLHPKLPA